ncbi:MAG TPA: CAP domain-containing protein [Solirubrobacterales bacterium]|nr:CAP domain-containing protein [Solirubrobacterales bacterium]
MNMGGKVRLAAGLVLAAVAIASLASLAVAERQPASTLRAAAADECKKAGTPVGRLSSGAVRNAVLCLVNEERRRHARKPVVQSKALQQAAQRHAEKMAATECLAHQCPGEGSLGSRIRRSGYPAGAKDWEFAENTGCGLSAEAMVKNWLASRYHRLNILDPRFEDLGVGHTRADVKGRCRDAFGTFAAVFAVRETR